ncbi:hypothetical protein QOM21_09675 [Streptomyces sp. Pv4-95]|uniref:hypothetical protein n=1 Tax=unclassified Streptomyces TaxID=2593676 RepID=UPI00371A6795
MRRTLATLLGAFALAGALSFPAHADVPGTGIAGVLGDPVKAASGVGPLQVGQLPLDSLLG